MTRLHRNEAGAEGARRIARAQIGAALRALEARPLSDEAVHAARKSLKRARAMLRLLRRSIGDEAYHRENAALRDAARPLSEIRDAKVLLQALDRFARGNRRQGRAPPILELQRLLRQKRAEIRSRLLREPGRFAGQLAALREARRRARHWRVGRRGWSVLGAGLRRVYGQAHRAFAYSRTYPAATRLHEWRKQTKYLWHQLQALEPLGPAVAQRAALAHRLADLLGEDHDLWVLRITVSKTVPAGSGRQTLLERIDHRSAQLRAQALELGERVYAETGPAFEAHLHSLWRAWRRAPRRARRTA